MTYLGCVLDETMSGETMALKFMNEINGILKFLYRKNRFLTPELRRMLCSALIQPHFVYAYPQLVTLILLKKWKRKSKLSKINA